VYSIESNENKGKSVVQKKKRQHTYKMEKFNDKKLSDISLN